MNPLSDIVSLRRSSDVDLVREARELRAILERAMSRGTLANEEENREQPCTENE
jgi:hypothetical protein